VWNSFEGKEERRNITFLMREFSIGQAINSAGEMVGTEVAVDHRHGNIVMPQDFLDRDEIHALHDNVGSESMAQRVNGDRRGSLEIYRRLNR